MAKLPAEFATVGEVPSAISAMFRMPSLSKSSSGLVFPAEICVGVNTELFQNQ